MVNLGKSLSNLKRFRFITILVIFSGFGMVFAFFIWRDYHRERNTVLSEKLNYLAGIVKTVSIQIDGDGHEKLKNYSGKAELAYAKDGLYSQLKSYLKQVQHLNNFKTDIYTLAREVGEKELYLLVNSSDSVFFRNGYEAPKYLLENFEQGGAFGPYEDDHGSWLSAFFPIYTSENEVTGVVQADIQFDKFEDEIIAEVLRSSLVTAGQFGVVFLLFIVFALFSGRYMNKIQKGILSLTTDLKLKNSELENAQQQLKTLNGALESKVQSRTQELSQRNRELGMLMYHSSHKMKTPVVNLLGLATLMKLDDVPKEYWEKIDQIARGMMKMLDSLNVAYSINGMVKWERVDMEAMLSTSIKSKKQSLCVSTDLSVNQKQVFYTDPRLIALCIDAIMENAFYFSYKCRKEAAQVTCTADVTHQEAVISIRDNGNGIAEKARKSVFDMFYIGTNISKGNGLGLFLANRAVKKLNGQIELHTQPNEYTMFVVKLPNGNYQNLDNTETSKVPDLSQS